MENKKKLQLGSIQANKFIAEIPEKREKLASSIQFRKDLRIRISKTS